MTGLYVFLGGLALIITTITLLNTWPTRRDRRQQRPR